MSIAGILRRWVLVSAVTGVLALIQVPGVRAQAVPSARTNAPEPEPESARTNGPEPGPESPCQRPR